MKTVENYCSAFFSFDLNVHILDCTAVVLSVMGNTTAATCIWELKVRLSQDYQSSLRLPLFWPQMSHGAPPHYYCLSMSTKQRLCCCKLQRAIGEQIKVDYIGLEQLSDFYHPKQTITGHTVSVQDIISLPSIHLRFSSRWLLAFLKFK